jgi:hypothetical protein
VAGRERLLVAGRERLLVAGRERPLKSHIPASMPGLNCISGTNKKTRGPYRGSNNCVLKGQDHEFSERPFFNRGADENS